MKIIGLDISTRITGWSIFENEQYVKSGNINLERTGKKIDVRLKIMSTQILQLLYREKPDVIVVESGYIGKNPKVALDLMRVRSVPFFYSLVANVLVLEPEPSEWRSILGFQSYGGQRTKYKKLVVKYVDKHFKQDVGDDEADAICLALSYINEYVAIGKYFCDVELEEE